MKLRVDCEHTKFYITVQDNGTIGGLKNIIRSVYKKINPHGHGIRIKSLNDDKHFLIPNEYSSWKIKDLFQEREIVHVDCEVLTEETTPSPVPSARPQFPNVVEDEKVPDSDTEESFSMHQLLKYSTVQGKKNLGHNSTPLPAPSQQGDVGQNKLEQEETMKEATEQLGQEQIEVHANGHHKEGKQVDPEIFVEQTAQPQLEKEKTEDLSANSNQQEKAVETGKREEEIVVPEVPPSTVLADDNKERKKKKRKRIDETIDDEVKQQDTTPQKKNKTTVAEEESQLNAKNNDIEKEITINERQHGNDISESDKVIGMIMEQRTAEDSLEHRREIFKGYSNLSDTGREIVMKHLKQPDNFPTEEEPEPLKEELNEQENKHENDEPKKNEMNFEFGDQQLATQIQTPSRKPIPFSSPVARNTPSSKSVAENPPTPAIATPKSHKLIPKTPKSDSKQTPTVNKTPAPATPKFTPPKSAPPKPSASKFERVLKSTSEIPTTPVIVAPASSTPIASGSSVDSKQSQTTPKSGIKKASGLSLLKQKMQSTPKK